MKKIKRVEIKDVTKLTPAEMNRIHFGGIHSPLTPEQIKEIAESAEKKDQAAPRS